jgi:hypothetical protein
LNVLVHLLFKEVFEPAKKITYGFFLLVIFSGTITAFCQNKVVTGMVVDSATGEGITGASINLNNTSRGVITDSRGAFKISVPVNALLEISSIGYKPIEIKASSDALLQIKLVSVNKALTDVVVVGYGTEKRSDITGSVTSVPKQRLSELPVTNVLQAIEGAVRGVNITESSSVPGSAPTAVIRGG